MAVKMLGLLALGLVFLSLGKARASQAVIHQMSGGFTKAVKECMKELELPESLMSDFADFWKEDFVLTNPSTGCVIICLSKKLDLIDTEGKLHHGNANEFAKKHGADDAMAAQLVQLIHGCFESTPNDENPCVKVMNIAMCFKKRIHELNWNPDMDLILGEVVAEV